MNVSPEGNRAPGAPPGISKWARMNFLRTESVRRRQRACQSKPTGTYVAIDHGEAGSTFRGLQTCGSLTCPVCGPRIAATRVREVEAAVDAHRSAGGRIGFGTLTLRHHRGQSLAFLLASVSACWKAATNGRGWRRDRLEHSVQGYARVFEVTYGRHGWHVHVHFLTFQDGDATPDGLLASMFRRWSDAAVRRGLGAPLMRAQDLHELRGASTAAQVLGLYFAKQAAELGAGDSAAIALEAAGGPLKAQGGLTPAELLDLAAAGDSAALRLWNEYELAMESARTIGWSRGLRDDLGLAAPLDDAAAAAAPPLHEHPERVEVPGPAWSLLVRTGRRGAVLEYATGHTPGELHAWLRAQGIDAYLRDLERDRLDAWHVNST